MGQKSLNQAADTFGSDKLKITWHPYIIDPGTKPEGEEYIAYNKRRWGGDGWTASLRRRGRECGANFRNWRWWPATLRAHCLADLASSKGLDSSHVQQVLFEALYEEGVNVSSSEALVDLAEERLGLDRDEVLAHLNSRSSKQGVLRDIQNGRRKYNISGVPYFVVTGPDVGPYVFSGALPSDQFLEMFQELAPGEA